MSIQIHLILFIFTKAGPQAFCGVEILRQEGICTTAQIDTQTHATAVNLKALCETLLNTKTVGASRVNNGRRTEMRPARNILNSPPIKGDATLLLKPSQNRKLVPTITSCAFQHNDSFQNAAESAVSQMPFNSEHPDNSSTNKNIFSTLMYSL